MAPTQMLTLLLSSQLHAFDAIKVAMWCSPHFLVLVATLTLGMKVEAADKKFQYLLFSAEPYEVIAFKIPNIEVDKTDGKLFTHW